MILLRPYTTQHLKLTKLNNKNKKKNWAQKLQKKTNFFPNKNYWISSKNKRLRFPFSFGNAVFTLPRPLLLSSFFITRFILNLKRVVRKRDKTLRNYWVTLRVFLRVTYQSKGARMGKGKGKHNVLLQNIPPFSSFIEFKGVRYGRLLFFLKFFNSKLPINSFLITHWAYALLKHRLNFFRKG